MKSKSIKDKFKWPDFRFFLNLDKFCHDKFRSNIGRFVIMEFKGNDGSIYDLVTTRNFNKEQCETLLGYLTKVCPMSENDQNTLSNVVNALESYTADLVWYNDYIFIGTVRADQLFNTPEFQNAYNEIPHDDGSILLGVISDMTGNFIYHYKNLYKDPKNAEELLEKIAIINGDKVINGFKPKYNGEYNTLSFIDRTFSRDEIKNFTEREIELMFRLSKNIYETLY